MADAPIRFVMDDAKAAERELRRGKTYDGIILDPPKYGRGPKGEIWKIDENQLIAAGLPRVAFKQSFVCSFDYLRNKSFFNSRPLCPF